MDLISKIIITAVVLIALAGVIILLSGHLINNTVTAQKAENVIISDLQQNNPGASFTVVNVTPSSLTNNSWSVTVEAIYNATRACPTVSIESFDYPATTFVPSLENDYASNCQVYGLSSAPQFVIGIPEIAVARSYQESPAAKAYVNEFGYNTTIVKAIYQKSINNTPFGNFTNVWLVNYNSSSSNYIESVLLDSSGNVAANYTNTK